MLTKPMQSPYLNWIKTGAKTFEGRLQPKIQEWDLFVGKRITFYDPLDEKSWVVCEITSLLVFKDFGEAFDSLGEKLIPEQTHDQVIKLYNKLFHYEDEDDNLITSSRMIRDNGVVAIGIRVIDRS